LQVFCPQVNEHIPVSGILGSISPLSGSGAALDTAKIAQIVGHAGEQSGTVYKITVGRSDFAMKDHGATSNAFHLEFSRQRGNNSEQLIQQGRQTFRLDTFGDEAFWGGQLQLYQAISTLTPRNALGLGLKVDAQALSPSLVEGIKHGKVNLDDPVVTRALMQQQAWSVSSTVAISNFLSENKSGC
jgi:hypothetical protein